ncbi:MAG: hypothetical protein ABIH52_02375 [Candidatus Aenigmatarchaeota archaeon]|nr:hypothetical protein [Nanoarchaeota archaeon]
MSYLWCIDHDGTASYGDIGRDYLCSLIGLTSEEFVDVVKNIRRDEDYKNEILKGGRYEEGLELAMLLAYNSVLQDDVRRSGENAENSLRKGFTEFLTRSERGRVIIFSAGVQDWLMHFYMKNFPNTNFDVVGTSLHVDEAGRYSSIKKPCGRMSKPDRIKDVLKGMNGHCIPKVGVGDSNGDRKMFDYVLKEDGLTIGISNGIEGDLNFSEDTDWYGPWFAGELYVDLMMNGKYAGNKREVLKQVRGRVGEMFYDDKLRRAVG